MSSIDVLGIKTKLHLSDILWSSYQLTFYLILISWKAEFDKSILEFTNFVKRSQYFQMWLNIFPLLLDPVIFNSLILWGFAFLAPPDPAAKIMFFQNYIQVGYLCDICAIIEVGFHLFVNNKHNFQRGSSIWFYRYVYVGGEIESNLLLLPGVKNCGSGEKKVMYFGKTTSLCQMCFKRKFVGGKHKI